MTSGPGICLRDEEGHPRLFWNIKDAAKACFDKFAEDTSYPWRVALLSQLIARRTEDEKTSEKYQFRYMTPSVAVPMNGQIVDVNGNAIATLSAVLFDANNQPVAYVGHKDGQLEYFWNEGYGISDTESEVGIQITETNQKEAQ